ncbi:SCP-like extracellular protein [Companilactobacillus farciminis]|nr:SCP-like extracellular protein [Companilactobacillus farciminis]
MKFSMGKSAAVLAALAVATTGAAMFNQTKAQASTVATVHSSSIALLYNSKGQTLTNRALAPNSAWAVGKIVTINNQTMYQVATDEYLSASDSSLNGQTQSNKLVGTTTTQLNLYNSKDGAMSSRALAKNSAWIVGKYIVNKDGQLFAQVSTNEYADATKMSFNMALPEPTYVADFGISSNFNVHDASKDENFNNENTNTSKDNSMAVGTIVNGDAPMYFTQTKGDVQKYRVLKNGSKWQVDRAIKDVNGNVYYEVALGDFISADHITVNKPVDTMTINVKFPGYLGMKDSTTTDNNQTSNNTTSTSDVASIQAALLKSINNERATKGIAPVTQTAALDNTAQIRAKEISTKFSHQRPGGGDCFSAFPAGGGYEAENIAEGYTGTPAQMVESLMEAFRAEDYASSHYTNLMDSHMTQVGLGVYNSNGTYYLVEDFMS